MPGVVLIGHYVEMPVARRPGEERALYGTGRFGAAEAE